MKIKNSEIRNLLENNQIIIVINPTKQFLEVEASVSKKIDELGIVLPAHEDNKEYKGMTFVYATVEETPEEVPAIEETPVTEEVTEDEEAFKDVFMGTAHKAAVGKAKRHRNPKVKWEVPGVGTYTNVNNAKWYAKQASKTNEDKKAQVLKIENSECCIEYENGKLVRDTWTTKRVK